MNAYKYILGGAVLFIAIVLAWYFLWRPDTEIDELRATVEQLQVENDHIRQEIYELKGQCEKLRKGDPTAVERIARDDLGYCREGEVVYPMEAVDASDPRLKNPPKVQPPPPRVLEPLEQPAYKKKTQPKNVKQKKKKSK